MKASGKGRTDSASRTIRATPQAIYDAFLDPEAVASWRPPVGMVCEIYAFDPREGGGYRMSFAYSGLDHAVPGKTSEHADVFSGRFAELVPGRRIVEEVVFDSADPSFASTMTVTTNLVPVAGGTEVTISCENVPSGIGASDHRAGIRSSLQNLAAFVE